MRPNLDYGWGSTWIWDGDQPGLWMRLNLDNGWPCQSCTCASLLARTGPKQTQLQTNKTNKMGPKWPPRGTHFSWGPFGSYCICLGPSWDPFGGGPLALFAAFQCVGMVMHNGLPWSLSLALVMPLSPGLKLSEAALRHWKLAFHRAGLTESQ